MVHLALLIAVLMIFSNHALDNLLVKYMQKLSLKDKIIFFLLLVVSVLSAVTEKTIIFYVALFVYVVYFTFEVIQYWRGNKVEGVLGNVIEKYEAMFGDFFTKIFMSFIILFFIMVLIFMFLEALKGSA